MAFNSPQKNRNSPHPHLSSSSQKSRLSLDLDSSDAPSAYDADRGAGGLARDFRRGLDRTVAHELNVRRPDANETKAFLKKEFEENAKQIDRDLFVRKVRPLPDLKLNLKLKLILN